MVSEKKLAQGHIVRCLVYARQDALNLLGLIETMLGTSQADDLTADDVDYLQIMDKRVTMLANDVLSDVHGMVERCKDYEDLKII